jgi:hypothetical protein
MNLIAVYKESSHDCLVGMFSTVEKAKDWLIENYGSLEAGDFFYRVYTVDKGDAGEDGLYKKEMF